MSIDLFPGRDELQSRVSRFQGHLRAQGIAAAVLLQNVDRYYFTGTMQGGHVVIPCEGEPLLLMRRDAARAAKESAFAVEEVASVREVPARIKARLGELPSPLGVEMDVLPVNQLDRLRSMFPGVELKDASRAIMTTRAVKSALEVRAIRRAAETVAAAVRTLREHLRPGVTELELAARLECELRLRGHAGLTRMRGFNQEMFFGHVMAGASAATVSFPDAPTGGEGLGAAMPHGSSRRLVEPGMPVIVDLVGNYQGYLSDQTRGFALERLDEPWPGAFEAALTVQKAVIAEARPGVPASLLYETALLAAAQTPFASSFLGERHKVSFVGHGIGLEVDEMPFLARGFDAPLEEGMVFALEPKFILEGRGVAGVEDTYVVTATGVERLTPSPQGVEIIEGGERVPLSKYRRLRQLWFVAFALGACMINYPLLQIFNRPVLLFGVPLPVLYFSVGWAASIGVIFVYSQALKKLPPDEGGRQ